MIRLPPKRIRADQEGGVDAAVLAVYGNPPFAWVGGLTILFDWSGPSYLDLYVNGDGATWSEETLWDDLLEMYAE